MSDQNGNQPSDDFTPEELAAVQLTAYALGQLHGDQRAEVERMLASDPESRMQHEIARIDALATAVLHACTSEPLPDASTALRNRLNADLTDAAKVKPAKKSEIPKRTTVRELVFILAALAACVVGVAVLLPALQAKREAARRMQSSNHARQLSFSTQNYHDTFQSIPYGARVPWKDAISQGDAVAAESQKWALGDGYQRVTSANDRLPPALAQEPVNSMIGFNGKNQNLHLGTPAASGESAQASDPLGTRGGDQRSAEGNPLKLREGELDKVLAKRTAEGDLRDLASQSERTRADLGGELQLAERGPASNAKLKSVPNMFGDAAGLSAQAELTNKQAISESKLRKDQLSRSLDVTPRIVVQEEEESLALKQGQGERKELKGLKAIADNVAVNDAITVDAWAELTARREKYPAVDLGKEMRGGGMAGMAGGEQYEPIIENPFIVPVGEAARSTFSIDVDTASYANMRRFLTSGRLPPRNSVRIEELVNYFRYDYPQPKGNDPFSVNMEVTECPWRLPEGEPGKSGHLLLRVGLKGKEIAQTERPASNLVFLLDVSGSMSDENKLPLLKTAMKLLVNELGENDLVSIVTYAGDAGLKLKSTRGHEQERITRVIDSLSAGGSTNGSAGIELAYEQATTHFIPKGTNRVILCTDGDLNVGVTSDEALTKLIKQKATSGVFLTVLGFGEGNLKDAKMEKLADNGNGLYAYIDSVREARKVLVEQVTGSTITIAKDVKIQIEFNPAQIAAYRLLGYENRVMAAEDFNNDKKDAGEIGAGHTVTALYELIPAGAAEEVKVQRAGSDPLKYQSNPSALRAPIPRTPSPAAASGELLTLKLRYKEPDGDTSKLLEYPLKDRGHSFNSASDDLQFAASVASFGMILRHSQYRGSSNLEAVAEIASGSLGKDTGGYRAEFIDLVRKAQAMGAR